MPSSTKYSTMLPVLRSYLHNPLRVLIHILPSEPSSILEISAHDIPSIGLIILLCRRNRPLPIVPIHMSPRLSGVTQLGIIFECLTYFLKGNVFFTLNVLGSMTLMSSSNALTNNPPLYEKILVIKLNLLLSKVYFENSSSPGLR